MIRCGPKNWRQVMALKGGGVGVRNIGGGGRGGVERRCASGHEGEDRRHAP